MTVTAQATLCLFVALVWLSLADGQLQANQTIPATIQDALNCTAVTTKPTPEAKKYTFKSCIVAQMSAYLAIEDGKYIEFNNGVVDENASKCENTTTPQPPQLVVNFECGSLSFSISQTNDSKTFVQAITGQYHIGNSTNLTFSNTTGAFYTTTSGHSYKCNAEQAIPVGANKSLVLSHLALEAFRDASGTDFYQVPDECTLDLQPVSDLVRIGVGVCLIALVAIVLAAYFIGRRRWSERSSYESV